MKFGTLYSYWGTKWQCDYLKTLKRVSDIGFDILEMGAPHLLEMSDYELSELRRAAQSWFSWCDTTHATSQVRHPIHLLESAMMKRFIMISGCGLNPLANTRSVPDFNMMILNDFIFEGGWSEGVIDIYDDETDGFQATKKRVS